MKFDSFCYSTEPCDTVSEYLVPGVGGGRSFGRKPGIAAA